MVMMKGVILADGRQVCEGRVYSIVSQGKDCGDAKSTQQCPNTDAVLSIDGSCGAAPNTEKKILLN